MMILSVAEKPSVASTVSKILSTTCNKTRGMHKYCPNIYFDTQLNSETVQMVFTSVLGHLYESTFQESGKWNESDPKILFHEQIIKRINPEHNLIAENIRRLAEKASLVVIWTDCDREGENIAKQIKSVVETTTRIQVKRARFSAITRNEIEYALRNLKEINFLEADAVDARIELDLRIGSAFTRIQTVSYGSNGVISFGPCQIPTLNFVVQRHNQIVNFIPETFYSLNNIVMREKVGNKEIVKNKFIWERGNVFDKNCVIHFFNALKDGKAVISNKEITNREKYRPLPLRTVEFQKVCSSYYKIDGHKLMSIAEKLYNNGYISYPRTETDSFPKGFGFRSVIEKLKSDVKIGEYAENFEFTYPRLGNNNDQAHSPIYPLKNGSNLQGDERKVFEFVARRFLGCISENAKGTETEYTMKITSNVGYFETFKCKGLTVTQRNYLDVYIYDKWESTDIGEFRIGEVVENNIDIIEGLTTRPEYLTESDLISLMDKNGIGTDATIHEHIQKIQTRRYVRKEKFKFIPEKLGINLIRAYEAIGLPISEPELRKNLETSLKLVCNGQKNKDELILNEIQEYLRIYEKLENNIDVYKEIMKDSGVIEPENNQVGNSKKKVKPKSARSDVPVRDVTERFAAQSTAERVQAENCDCGAEAKLLEAKKGSNAGKEFYTCHFFPKQCQYFCWKDGVRQKPADNKRCETTINCFCGYESQKKIANTEINRGREFFCCKKSYKKCSFFKWADEI